MKDGIDESIKVSSELLNVEICKIINKDMVKEIQFEKLNYLLQVLFYLQI